MNNLVLTYIPGVCVFHARSGFNPRWAYVLVCSCAACLICRRLGSCIVGFLMCLALHNQTSQSEHYVTVVGI